MTIWKYTLSVTNEQKISMPSGAQLLTVQLQGGMPCLWALVNPAAPQVERKIRIHGTGHEVQGGEYVETFQWGPLVFHVFDAGEYEVG